MRRRKGCSITSPFTETVLLAIVAASVTLVLGVGWLIYLGRGGRPLDLRISGFGIRVELNKPKGESKDEHPV